MVDTTTLIVAATLMQTAVITLTLLVFIFQFRSQEKAIRESSYQNLMGRYNDFLMMQVSRPELSGLFTERMRSLTNREPSAEDAAIFGHLMIAYGIIEEAHALYRKKWIDKETWEQWAAWLKTISTYPLFRQMHLATRGMFDKEYEDFVARTIGEK